MDFKISIFPASIFWKFLIKFEFFFWLFCAIKNLNYARIFWSFSTLLSGESDFERLFLKSHLWAIPFIILGLFSILFLSFTFVYNSFSSRVSVIFWSFISLAYLRFWLFFEWSFRHRFIAYESFMRPFILIYESCSY